MAETMVWQPFMIGRTRCAFPDPLLLVRRELNDLILFSKSAVWTGWMAYRGLVWEFGGTVNATPWVLVKGRHAKSPAVLTTYTRSALNGRVVNSLNAVVYVDTAWRSWFKAPDTWYRPVDNIPWEIHAISDIDARRAAGSAYQASLD